MKRKKSKKSMDPHVQISSEIDWKKFQPGDRFIYAIIKSYMNNETKQCNPSVATLKQECQCGEKRLYEALTRFKNAGLITISKNEGGSNQYNFIGNYDNFEMFSIKFLKELDLAPQIKDYYMCIQEYLYKHPDTDTAEMTYDNETLREITGLTIRTIQRYNMILASKGIMIEEILKRRDRAGLQVKRKVFDLQKLEQTVILDHEERITSVEDRLDKLEEQYNYERLENQRLRELLKRHNIFDSEKELIFPL